MKNHHIFVGSCPVSTVFSTRTVYTERTNNNHMVVISAGASIFQVNVGKLRRPLDTGFGRTSGFR